MSIIFNQIYLNKEMLPKYPPTTHTHINTHTHALTYKYK